MAYIELQDASLQYPTNLRRAETEKQPENIKVAGKLVHTGLMGVSVQAIEPLTLKLTDGDRLGIIGSNGSGKTSLLRMLAGIYSPTSGSVEVDGRVASMFSIGLGMQPEATGMRNIKLAGLVAGASSKQIKAALPDIKAFTELGEYLKMPIRTYSQGMSMRLKFACATAFKPDIVLLDEWIGAGDFEFQKKAGIRLNNLLSDAGIIVVATHNRPLIKRMTNKLIWLERGKLMGYGPTEQILEQKDEAEKKASREMQKNFSTRQEQGA